MLRCADDRRTVTWLTGLGRFRARLCGPTAGNPLLRRAQHRAHEDQRQRLAIAQRMIAGKLHNSRQVLLRAARDAAGTRQATLREAADRHARLPSAGRPGRRHRDPDGNRGSSRPRLLRCLSRPVRPLTRPVRRTRRPPATPVNCLLSFLYGMLRVAVHGALEQAGLDPYIGYLHGVRPGKPGLALDLMEELATAARRPSCRHPAQPRRTPRQRLPAPAWARGPPHRRCPAHCAERLAAQPRAQLAACPPRPRRAGRAPAPHPGPPSGQASARRPG